MVQAKCHPDKKHYAHGLCANCYRRKFVNGTDKERQWGIKKRGKLKLEVLTHYSPNEVLNCSWEGCPINDIDMLSLDHKKDNGASHRRAMGVKNPAMFLYSLLRRTGYPEGYQTLCMNHQFKKKMLKDRG